MGGIPSFSTCENAGGDGPLDYPYEGVIDNLASVDLTLLSCLDAFEDLPDSSFYLQEDGSNKVLGVWYTAQGDGGLMTVSVCELSSAETTVLVFEGETCSNLDCIDGVYDEAGCAFSWNSSFVEYSLLVLGTEVDTFELSVTSTGPTSVPNDKCDSAPFLEIDFPPIFGSTNPATLDDDAPTCSNIEVDSPGVWYAVLGTGERLLASTCFGSDYDTKLHIYQGSSCASLECVIANDDGPASCGFQSSAEWDTSPGTLYYILISGFSSTGRYGIEVTSIS
jgi:hypothetical protein